MITDDRFTPRNQADCDHANALRDYERAHAAWMNTPIHTDAGKAALAAKNTAREAYLAAYQAANPTHGIIGG